MKSLRNSQTSDGYCEDNASDPGPSTSYQTRCQNAYSSNEISALTTSSPPVLEPSRDESRSAGGVRKPNIFRRLFLSRSQRVTLTERDPLISGGRSNESNAGHQMTGQVEEGSTNCGTVAFNSYATLVTKFRNSDLIFIPQLLFFSIPFSAIIMGALFAENCTKMPFLPIYGAVLGVLGAIFMIVCMSINCSNPFGIPCSDRQKLVIGLCLSFIFSLTIVDVAFVASLSPSSDPASSGYCSETFYTYAIYKEIATVVVIALSAIIYIPRSRHTLCCQDCSMRTANSFYYSI